VTVATAVAKVLVWSGCRREEIMGLVWDSLRALDGEYHFAVVGKWGVKKWFRVPGDLYQELLSFRTGNSFVFAGYNEQLRRYYRSSNRPGTAGMVGAEFSPSSLGDWFHERVVEWSRTLPGGKAYTHIFRKTALQYARAGESVNRAVAEDAKVSEGVMVGHYVKETDEELRNSSNRTYQRMIAGLPPDVALRYGHTPAQGASLQDRLKAAPCLPRTGLRLSISLLNLWLVRISRRKGHHRVHSCELL
jgi:hypothetical protein